MKPKALLSIGALLVIVLTNAVALGGAWWNRSGEAESRLELSQRELRVPYRGIDRESSGLSLSLAWRVGAALDADDSFLEWQDGRSPRWLDRAKMESLGFDLPDDSASVRRKAPELARDVLLVLELDGEAFRRALERARQRRAAEELKLAVLPESKEKENRRKSLDNELAREENESSRLFVIDAGLDSAALRRKYPDRARYAIVQGQIRPMWRGREGDPVRGYVSSLSVGAINVPHALRALVPANGDRTKFSATVAFGRRLEPWIEQVTVSGR